MATEKAKPEEKNVSDRQKALDTALAQIERQFGKGSVIKMSDKQAQVIEVIPTGSIALDIALGIGGLPRGRIIEIYGPESSGKTTLTLHAIANAQKAGGICAFIDAEHAFDAEYAKKLGVDIDALLVSQPDTGEQALEIMDMLIRSGALDLVVVDSVAALVPRAEIEGEMGDSHMGLQARLMSQALRKVTGALHQSKTTAIFINQLREKIGVFFGSPETTTGGKALSSTHLFALISVVSKLSKMDRNLSVTVLESKSSRIRWLHHLSRLSSTSSTALESHAKDHFSIWALSSESSRNLALGTPTKLINSAKVKRIHAPSLSTILILPTRSRRRFANPLYQLQ